MSSLEHLSENLKQLRKEQNFTQTDLARACEFAVSYVNKIEAGERSPSFEKLDRLAEELDVEPYELIKPD